MEMILRERSCREIIYHGKTCVKDMTKKRNKKTPSGTEDLSQRRDSIAPKWKTDNSKTYRGSLPDR